MDVLWKKIFFCMMEKYKVRVLFFYNELWDMYFVYMCILMVDIYILFGYL